MTEVEDDILESIDISDAFGDGKKLVVYNDDHNSFDHVINCFIAIFHHSDEQATQLAEIIHNRGKATVKECDDETKLKHYLSKVLRAGLKAKIE